jgi:golgi-specific brefeldin A-resistance guanine nucleotide exchange factor 1
MKAMSDVALPESFDGSRRAPESSSLALDGNHISAMGQHPWRSSERRPPSRFDMSSRPTPISVAVDPVALITTECITVTSAMRKHARWAHSSVSAILGGSSPSNPGRQSSRPATPGDDINNLRRHKARSSITDGEDDGGLANRWGLRGKKGKSMQDNPLMAGFGRLRRELAECKGI